MLSLRTRIFIIISLVVLIVLVVSMVLIVAGKKKQKEAENNLNPSVTVIDQNNYNSAPTGEIAPAATQAPQGTPVKQLTSVEVEQNAVKQLAKIFIERYGSYSTDNNSQNIIEVQGLVTPSLWSSISKRIGVASANSSFVGATVQAVGANISEWRNNSANVSVSLLRTEEKTGATTSSNMNASISLIKTGGSWLVNAFEIK